MKSASIQKPLLREDDWLVSCEPCCYVSNVNFYLHYTTKWCRRDAESTNQICLAWRGWWNRDKQLHTRLTSRSCCRFPGNRRSGTADIWLRVGQSTSATGRQCKDQDPLTAGNYHSGPLNNNQLCFCSSCSFINLYTCICAYEHICRYTYVHVYLCMYMGTCYGTHSDLYEAHWRWLSGSSKQFPV